MENPISDKSSDLGGSFRQSRKELWVMLGAWVVFFAWTLGYCSVHSGETEILLGIPRWVLIGIALPWMLANVFTIWFAMCFMKDTLLEDDAEGEEVMSDP